VFDVLNAASRTAQHPCCRTDYLGVDDRMTFDPRRFLNNARITFRPVSGVHCVEFHSAIADVNLEPVAVMLQLMHPACTARWPRGDRRTAGQNETGRPIPGPAARGTLQHGSDIAAKICFSTRRKTPNAKREADAVQLGQRPLLSTAEGGLIGSVNPVCSRLLTTLVGYRTV